MILLTLMCLWVVVVFVHLIFVKTEKKEKQYCHSIQNNWNASLEYSSHHNKGIDIVMKLVK